MTVVRDGNHPLVSIPLSASIGIAAIASITSASIMYIIMSSSRNTIIKDTNNTYNHKNNRRSNSSSVKDLESKFSDIRMDVTDYDDDDDKEDATTTTTMNLLDTTQKKKKTHQELKDSMKLLNKLNPKLQSASRAKIKRTATTFFRDQPNSTHVIRIVLTGGPCAGKSSALTNLRKQATKEGFDVYCAPEVATLLFNSGIQFPTNDHEIFNFQRSVVVLQLVMERNLTKIVSMTGRPSIIIFDRGLLDSKGYMPNHELWLKILNEMTTGSGKENSDGTGEDPVKGITEDYCLKRYDGVIHLVTAADGAIDYYKHGTVTDDEGKVVLRSETPQKAIELDRKMQSVWKNHPRQVIIKNRINASFKDKINAATEAVLKIARETHPREYTKASFYIKGATAAAAAGMNDDLLGNMTTTPNTKSSTKQDLLAVAAAITKETN